MKDNKSYLSKKIKKSINKKYTEKNNIADGFTSNFKKFNLIKNRIVSFNNIKDAILNKLKFLLVKKNNKNKNNGIK